MRSTSATAGRCRDKLTLTAGLRYEYYPLMMRSDRGIERLDFSTFNVLLGGVGSVPDDLGIQVSKNLWAPRLGAAYRLNEKTVLRAGYGITYNPIPWSRPLRGFYPLTIGYTNAIANSYDTFALAAGIPTIPLPDVSTGSVPLPRNVQTRTPDADNVERGRTQQYNVTVEREVFADISVSLAYVGTRTDGGYADVNANYAESGGNTKRHLFAQAGTAAILEWGSITRSRYNSLQMAVNRPFKNGLLLKGAYTWSKAMNETDEDGWATKVWSQPSQMDAQLRQGGLRPDAHLPDGVRLRAAVCEGRARAWSAGWRRTGRSTALSSAFSGTPFTIAGDNTALNQQGGQQTIQQIGEIARLGDAGPDAPFYDPAAFAQPGNRWGNTGRNFLRGPKQWNLDLAVFKGVNFGGRYRVEFRAQAINVLNHTRWGNPVTGFTDPNFLRIRTNEAGGNIPRKVQLGLRFQF